MATTRIPVAGLSKLAASVFGGGDSYDSAYQGELGNQSKIGAAVASMRLNNAKADAEEAALAAQSPDAVIGNAMTALNIPQAAKTDVQSQLRDGYIGKYNLPSNQQGPTEPAPDWTKNLGSLGRLVAATQNAIALGDKNSGNVADAFGKFDNINKQDQVIAGTLPASSLGQAVAAAAGKPLYDIKEFGSGNVYTGAVDTNNPVAERYGKYRDSETGKNKAQASASYASANNSNASAKQHAAQIDLIRSKIGQTQTTTLPDGSVVTTGPSGGVPKLTELQGKAQLFGSRAAEADRIISDLGTFNPSAINAKQQVEGWPVIGGVLGPLTNKYALTEKDQLAEQAQRDFINAILRQESGAAIAESEFDNAKKQYFPEPGDTPAKISQKAANRKTAIQGLRIMSGPAADRVQPQQPSANRNVKVNY